MFFIILVDYGDIKAKKPEFTNTFNGLKGESKFLFIISQLLQIELKYLKYIVLGARKLNLASRLQVQP